MLEAQLHVFLREREVLGQRTDAEQEHEVDDEPVHRHEDRAAVRPSLRIMRWAGNLPQTAFCCDTGSIQCANAQDVRSSQLRSGRSSGRRARAGRPMMFARRPAAVMMMLKVSLLQDI